MRIVLLAGIFCCLFVSQAWGEDKFAQMDTNADDQVTWEEFQAARPSMKRAAFDAIDQNKDERLSREEMQSFTASHGNRQGMSAPHKPLPSGEGERTMPLIRPPKDAPSN